MCGVGVGRFEVVEEVGVATPVCGEGERVRIRRSRIAVVEQSCVQEKEEPWVNKPASHRITPVDGTMTTRTR